MITCFQFSLYFWFMFIYGRKVLLCVHYNLLCSIEFCKLTDGCNSDCKCQFVFNGCIIMICLQMCIEFIFVLYFELSFIYFFRIFFMCNKVIYTQLQPFHLSLSTTKSLHERKTVLLTPKNDTSLQFNNKILQKLEGNEKNIL